MAPCAPTWRRGAAAALDLVFGGLLAMLLAPWSGNYFAERAVVALRIGEPGTFWQGPLPMVLGIFGEVVYGLPFALVVVALVGVSLGTSPGAAALGLGVRRRDGGALTIGRLLGRALVATVGLWLLVVALALGSGALLALASLVTLVMTVDALLALGRSGVTIADRWARSLVVRRVIVSNRAGAGTFGAPPGAPAGDVARLGVD